MARLTVGPVRLSFVNVFEPRPNTTPGAKPKYGATLLIPKTATQTMAKINAAIDETKAEYGAKNPKATWIRQPKLTLHDGDGFRPTGEEFGPECKGHWVLGTSSQRQPMIVDANKIPILDSNEVYSGCYALAVINFYAYDTAGNKGIACALDGIMKTGDGERFGGGHVTVNAFDNVAADDLKQLNALLD